LGALAAIILLASCGGPAPSGSGSQSGTTIVIADPATPSTLDPDFSNTDQSWAVMQNAYGSFTDFDVTKVDEYTGVVDLAAGPKPSLAASWERAEDGLSFTVTLRSGVKSLAGNELTTQDVVWSWQRALGLEAAGLFPLGVTSTNFDDPITVVDDLTFVVNLTGANPLWPLANAIPLPFAPIFDSTEAKKHATADDPWARDWLGTHTAGYGPYTAESFVAGVEVVWAANPNYFGGPLPAARIVFRQVPEETTRLSLIKSGEVDIATFLGARARADAAESAGVRVLGVEGNLGMILGLNTKVAPLDQREVRQAIAYAVPIEDIIRTAFLDSEFAKDFKGVVPSSYPFAWDYWPYTYDIDRAKELMSSAGVDSAQLTLAINSTHPQQEQTAVLIRDSLAQIGISIEIQSLTPARYQEQYFGRTAEMVLVEDTAWVPDPAYALANFFSPGTPGTANWVNYSDPVAADLMQRALDEPDPAKRLALAEQANKIIVDDAAWPMYIGTGTFLTVRDNIHGYVWRTDNLLDFRYFTKQQP
jgi:peptide/nickel transport system substrate-binding protein